MLFRTHVSRMAAGNARAVLEGVGLDKPTIDLCFRDNPLNVEEAVQDGLTRWAGGLGSKPPTWKVLTDAMDYAGIAKHYVQGLKNKLGMSLVLVLTTALWTTTIALFLVTIRSCYCRGSLEAHNIQ